MNALLAFKTEEEGIILPFMALAMIAIFALMGLAIDGGRMYSAQLAVQTWADASAFSSAAQIALESNDYDSIPNIVINDAKATGRHLALQHSRRSTYRNTNFSANIDVDTGGGTITVSSIVQMDIPLYFMRVVPGFGSTRVIQARASSEVAPTLGVLALDASGSMNCPTNTGCGCFPDCGVDAGKKFTAVLNVVQEAFLNRFDRARDQISVIMYDKVVNEIVSIEPGGGFTDLTGTQIDEYSNTVKEFDASNLSLAIMRAYDILEPFVQLNPDRQPFIAILSDGGPTATCMEPVDITPGVESDFDTRRIVCYWEIHWEGFFDPDDPENATNPDLELRKPGISVLGGATDFNTTPTDWNDMEHAFNPPPCSGIIPSPGQPAVPTFPPWGGRENIGPPEDAIDEVEACLQSYRTRNLNGTVYPSGPNNLPSDAPINELVSGRREGVNNWRKSFYHHAIVQADAVRSRGFVFYTIGMGLQAPTSGVDPYNDIDDVLGKKNNLLERIALMYHPLPVSEFPPHTTASTTLLRGMRAHTKGEFYDVTDPSPAAIAVQFRELVRRLKLQMVN